MKSLQPSGSTLIHVTRPFVAGQRLHDPWPSHAAYYVGLYIYEAQSHEFFLFFTVQLEDGVIYQYPFARALDESDLSAIVYSMNHDPFPFYGSPAIGEFWNYQYRDLVFDKFPDDELHDWLVAH